MKILGSECRLSQMLDTVCQSIAALDPKAEGCLVMFEQIAAARPNLRAQFEVAVKSKPGNQGPVQLLIGAAGVMAVKEVPALISGLVHRIDQPDSPPALRCALVAVLAYVVQPRDIVPDDAPGGYGFLDDAAMLVASALLNAPSTQANATEVGKLDKKLSFLLNLLPEAAGPALQLAVQGIALLFQTMSALPPQLAQTTMRQLLDNPESVSAPAAPAGWQSPFPARAQAGHWSHGAYFEGNDVFLPGGPSLVGGQLYIPS